MWTFDPNRYLKGSANPPKQRKRHSKSTTTTSSSSLSYCYYYYNFLLSSLFRSLTEVRHRLHVSNCCRTMSSGEDPQDEACWCSLIEGDARGGSFEQHRQFPYASSSMSLPAVCNSAPAVLDLMLLGGDGLRRVWKISWSGASVVTAMEKLSPMLGKAPYWCCWFRVAHSRGSNPLPMLSK